VYRALAHPRWLEIGAGIALGATAIALGAVIVARWRRDRTTLPLAGLCGLLVTVWSWTIFSATDPLLRYAIPALHSVQYLYFVWLLRRNRARAEEAPPHFGRPVAVRVGALAITALALGWLLFHGAPGALDAMLVSRPRRGALPDDLGTTPYLAAFFVVVSVHHYFMDAVLWRRENRETRFLIDATPATPATRAAYSSAPLR
jgi:hypothetical protein